MPGCGIAPTTENIDMAAVTVDRDGSPVLLVRVCKDGIDTVSVFAQREGLPADEPTPVDPRPALVQPGQGSSCSPGRPGRTPR